MQNSFVFAWWWVLLVLPAPFFIRRYLPAVKRDESTVVNIPFKLVSTDSAQPHHYKHNQLMLLLALVWCSAIFALMRPQWVGDPVHQPITGRDLVIAVDLSGSMLKKDMTLNKKSVPRLTLVKDILGRFITERQGDKLGLILFGTAAYLQAPLTHDRNTVKQFLDESVIGLAGEQTAIGDAIALTTKYLSSSENQQKVLILLTDGQNTAGSIDIEAALSLANDINLKIYTIGVGSESGVMRTIIGNIKTNPSSDLDEGTLVSIADNTGGQYFRAREEKELIQISRILNQLEPTSLDDKVIRPIKELYFWPLSLCLVLMTLICIVLIRR